jgi:F-type H+-transporting ATPase subunit a
MLDLFGTIAGGVNPLEKAIVKELFRFDLFGLEIVFSNHMFMIGLATIVLLVILPLSVRGKGMVRSGFGNGLEMVCVFIREDVARPFLGDKTDKHIGFIWTIFFFVLSLNLLGMVPFAGIIYLVTGKASHLEGAATANIWITGTLAFITFFSIHIAGIREQGVWQYIKNFAPEVPWPMIPFIYLMEIIGALVKPVSLAVRLFANIFAGHVLIATLFMFIIIFKSYGSAVFSVAAVVAASMLELLVAFLQAYIFTFLSTIFIGFAVHPEH